MPYRPAVQTATNYHHLTAEAGLPLVSGRLCVPGPIQSV